MSPQDRLFGEFAIKLGLVPRETVVELLSMLPSTSKTLSDLLLERALITPEDAQRISSHQQRVLHASARRRPPHVARPSPGEAEVAPRDSVPLAPETSTTQRGSGTDSTLDARMAAPREARSAVNMDNGQQGTTTVSPKRASSRNASEPYLHKVLRYAAKSGASDVHLHSGAPLMMRKDGTLQPLKGEQPVAPETAKRLLQQILEDDQRQQLEQRGQVDFAYTIAGLGRFRVNAYKQFRGTDAAFRIIPDRVPGLTQLGLPEVLTRLTDFRTGIVLCTGPAGCGKSTTLAALLQRIVDQRREHVITFENPVEFVLRPNQSWVNQRQVGTHTESFARALRAALREDPDVLAITELRDRESIALALTAAETGHLVLGTLHTGSAGQTIDRMINAFSGGEQGHIRAMLSDSLRAVVSQRLVPRADGNGRAVAIEVLLGTTAVANLIRDNKTLQLPSIMQTGIHLGMITLDNSLQSLVESKVITKEQASRFANAKERFR